MFVVTFLSIISLCNGENVETVNNDKTHQQILKWWETSSVQKPIGCNINVKCLQPFPQNVQDLYKKDSNLSKVIESKPCQNGEKFIYQFRGKGNGEIHGPGKLKKITPPSDFNPNHPPEGHFCLDVTHLAGGNSIEWVGTFHHGTLHGTAKIADEDGSKIIGNFQEGQPFGLFRYFDSNGNLIDALFMNKDRRKKGPRWLSRQKGYLVYHSTQLYEDRDLEKPSDVVISKDTSEIYVGNYNSGLGFLENVHLAEVKISSAPEDCLMELEWTVGPKQDFIVFLANDIKIPLENKKTICQSHQPEDPRNVEEQFRAFKKYLNQHYNLTNGAMAYVYDMKPEAEPVDLKAVRQPFVSNLTLYSDKGHIKANFSLWNGPVLSWSAEMISVDKDLKLHGFVMLQLGSKDYNTTGRHDFLGWSLKFIAGKFVHGKLDGVVTTTSWREQYGIFHFKEGVIHGPALVHGVIPILDAEVSSGSLLHCYWRRRTVGKRPLFCSLAFSTLKFQNMPINLA